MLPCEADGLPPPDIMWHKDGHVIMESVRQRILSSGALQIAFAQPGDAGQYTCMAANVAGSSSTSTKLTVHGRLFSISYFSSLLYHGREKRPPGENMMEIKTMKNSKPERRWCVNVVCRYASFRYVFGRLCLFVHTPCKSDFIHKARIINLLPAPSYGDYWDL